MWLLPSRGRPHLIGRVFSKAKTRGAPGLLVVGKDQAKDYEGVRLPPSWSIHIVERMHLTPTLNAVFNAFPGAPWYGILCDDNVPETDGWDAELPEAAGPWGVSWPDDGLKQRTGTPVLGGELTRALGFLSCPAVQHFYADDAVELIVAELDVGVPRLDVKVPHLHFTTGKTPRDQTTNERPPASADRAAFWRWRDEDWPVIRERVKIEKSKK